MQHENIWRGPGQIAAKHGLSACVLAKRAGPGPLGLNRSKREGADGRPRRAPPESHARKPRPKAALGPDYTCPECKSSEIAWTARIFPGQSVILPKDNPVTDDPQTGLDPQDWPAFRESAHTLLDAAMDKMQAAREGRVWTPFPPEMKAAFDRPLPEAGRDEGELAEQLAALLPYGAATTHPLFFGRVHGSGTPQNLLAEIVAAATKANAGGRDHGAIHGERQVICWCCELFGFPGKASGLIVSGISMATIIALNVAHGVHLAFASRAGGVTPARLVG